jgi:hypothetical protein
VKKLFALLLIIILYATLLCGCGEKQQTDGEVTLVLCEGEGENVVFSVQLSDAKSNTAAELLNYLNDANIVVSQISGGWLQSIGSLQPTGNSYLALFVNNIEWADVSAYALTPIEFDGETLYYCGYGLADITLFDRLILMVVLTTY